MNAKEEMMWSFGTKIEQHIRGLATRNRGAFGLLS
jgi:hypothetical protein